MSNQSDKEIAREAAENFPYFSGRESEIQNATKAILAAIAESRAAKPCPKCGYKSCLDLSATSLQNPVKALGSETPESTSSVAREADSDSETLPARERSGVQGFETEIYEVLKTAQDRMGFLISENLTGCAERWDWIVEIRSMMARLLPENAAPSASGLPKESSETGLYWWDLLAQLGGEFIEYTEERKELQRKAVLDLRAWLYEQQFNSIPSTFPRTGPVVTDEVEEKGERIARDQAEQCYYQFWKELPRHSEETADKVISAIAACNLRASMNLTPPAPRDHP